VHDNCFLAQFGIFRKSTKNNMRTKANPGYDGIYLLYGCSEKWNLQHLVLCNCNIRERTFGFQVIAAL
jgi:hypothetical protein